MNEPLKICAMPSDAGALLAAGSALGAPHKNPDADGRAYAVVHKDYTVEELPTRPLPERPQALVKLRDGKSFIRYVGDHAVAQSRIYATLEPAKFLAVFDDFPMQDDDDAALADQAAWRGYRAQFEVPPSREWKLWTATNRKQMGQLAFAEFLQDNLPDVTVPNGAELLEMCLNIEAAQKGTFVSAARLRDGSHDLVWKADNGGDSVKLPPTITLEIPVFENEVRRRLEARLRFRINEGALAIWFELVRPHAVLEEAFRALWAEIEEHTSLQILLGSPE